jgi:hypothetical protein
MLRKMNDLLSRAFMPLGMKIITMAAFIALISIGLSASSGNASLISETGHTNLGNLIVWSYWWPLIIIVSIFFGRIWCMVCPVEPITSFFAKFGFRLKRPKWLLSGWAITVFYMLILFIGIEGLAIDHNPYFMAVYMLAILFIAVLSGVLFEKNTFCRYICPVGYLLGLHARLSFYGWRVKDKMLCEQCMDKSCVHKRFVYNQNYKSCGVDLYPAEIEDNSACILCAGCRKACDSYKTEKINGRPNPAYTYIGFANDLFRVKPLLMAEMIFLWILSGFVISENMEEWGAGEKMMNYFPDLIDRVFSIHSSLWVGLIYAAVAFIILPVFFWIIPFLVSKLTGTVLTLREYILNYSLAFIPIMAAAHLGKSLLQSASGIPYLKPAFADASGITSAQKIISGQMSLQDNPVWLSGFVWLLFCLIMIAGILISIKVVSIVNHKYEHSVKTTRSFYLIPFLYGSIFMILLLMLWK